MPDLDPRARAEADDRFAASAKERERTESYLRAGRLWQADTPERVEKRKNRLLTEPAVAKNLSPAQREILRSMPLPEVPEGVLQAFEAQIGGKDTQPCWFLTRGAQVRRGVGRIHIRDATRRVGWATGFLVAPNLLLTNQHVLDSPATAGFSRVEFDYEETYDGDFLASAMFDLRPDVLFLSDAAVGGMDYALVAVAERARPDSQRADAELSEFGFHRLLREEGKLVKGEPVNCVHHPEGQGRQLGIRGNRLMALSDPALAGTWMHYETDTAPGSSGCPLFNSQWEVVGIHHRSAEKRDEQGRVLAIGGGLWTPEMGERQIWWYANEGLRISRFVAHVEERLQGAPADGEVRTGDGSALVARMLDGTPAPGDPSPVDPPPVHPVGAPEPVPAAGGARPVAFHPE